MTTCKKEDDVVATIVGECSPCRSELQNKKDINAQHIQHVYVPKYTHIHTIHTNTRWTTKERNLTHKNAYFILF